MWRGRRSNVVLLFLINPFLAIFYGWDLSTDMALRSGVPKGMPRHGNGVKGSTIISGTATRRSKTRLFRLIYTLERFATEPHRRV